MKIIIRADASVSIGNGHVMRCLTIAKKLREKGCHIKFWMEPLKGNLINFVENEGFINITEAENADLYIVDHYKIDKQQEQRLRKFTKKLMVIDDLAREHDCDLLLDQNALPNFEIRYNNLVPERCVKLLGPKYLIIRDEFIEVRQQMSKHSLSIKRLLVFMGGTDPTKETLKILKALKSLNFLHVDVVVGNGNPMKEQIKQICYLNGYYYHCQINYMAMLMQQADFSIGAGGSTLWERCYVGLPSSATIVADNQVSTTEFAASLGVVKNLGWHDQVTVKAYEELLTNIDIEGMSEKALKLTENKLPYAWVDEILELN